MRNKKQSAFIFPAAIILISIAMFISIISTYLHRQSALLRLDQINHTNTDILDGTLNQLSINNSLKVSTLDIYQADLSLYLRKNYFSNIPSQTLITYLTLIDKSQYPQFDFNLILKNKLNCTDITIQKSRLSPAGSLFTAGSSVWPETCQLKAPVYSENIIYEENLQADLPLEIQSTLITSAGYVYLNNKVITDGDLIILSAGDLYIRHLHSEQHNLTLISVGGIISIDLLSGEPKLRLISKYGHFIAGKTYPQSEILLPPLKEISIISLK